MRMHSGMAIHTEAHNARTQGLAACKAALPTRTLLDEEERLKMLPSCRAQPAAADTHSGPHFPSLPWMAGMTPVSAYQRWTRYTIATS